MQGPRADFACLSKKCQQDGASTVYELPVGAIRCPVCGSKRIQRLYNAINVASGIARKVDAIVEPAYTEAQAVRSQAEEGVRQKRVAPAISVPMHKVAGVLSGMGAGPMALQKGPAIPMPSAPSAFAPIQRRPPMPGPGSMRDREFTIRGGQVERA